MTLQNSSPETGGSRQTFSPAGSDTGASSRVTPAAGSDTSTRPGDTTSGDSGAIASSMWFGNGSLADSLAGIQQLNATRSSDVSGTGLPLVSFDDTGPSSAGSERSLTSSAARRPEGPSGQNGNRDTAAGRSGPTEPPVPHKASSPPVRSDAAPASPTASAAEMPYYTTTPEVHSGSYATPPPNPHKESSPVLPASANPASPTAAGTEASISSAGGGTRNRSEMAGLVRNANNALGASPDAPQNADVDPTVTPEANSGGGTRTRSAMAGLVRNANDGLGASPTAPQNADIDPTVTPEANSGGGGGGTRNRSEMAGLVRNANNGLGASPDAPQNADVNPSVTPDGTARDRAEGTPARTDATTPPQDAPARVNDRGNNSSNHTNSNGRRFHVFPRRHHQ